MSKLHKNFRHIAAVARSSSEDNVVYFRFRMTSYFHTFMPIGQNQRRRSLVEFVVRTGGEVCYL